MLTHLRPLSRAEVRALDRLASDELGLPSLVLMENAGHGAASFLAELVEALHLAADGRRFGAMPSAQNHDIAHGPSLPKVLILCGPGNNGGDGGVVARHLDAWAFNVCVIWFTQSNALHGDAAIQWSILQRSGMDQSAWFDTRADKSNRGLDELAVLLGNADWLVDGLLGTGLSRPVEGPLRDLIELMNKSGKPILALDLPSGLDADTGEPLGMAVRATATATFVAAKKGFSTASAATYTGRVAIIDIGLPRRLLEPFHLP
jgi:NAD(P)H-hydrate epimerase